MKTILRIALFAALLATMTGCDAFNSLTKSRSQTSLGSPYELIVVCPQQEWTGELGDTLRAVFTAPIPYLNQTEPLFDILRVNERGFTDMVIKHRNILKVVKDPALAEAGVTVQYNVKAEPQIVLTLQGPNDKSLTAFLSANRENIVHVLEKAERDRAVKYAEKYNEQNIRQAIKDTFGVDMTVPKGYVLATNDKDFLWARYEYPSASQGFFIYSYPYKGKESLSPGALLAARNKFAARIPGPSDGSYMTTSDVIEPDYRMFRMEGRLWCEMRGFWDVHGDFMGGPFVSYTTVDTATNRVFTLDCYIYSPKNHKRNYMRGVEHLLYLVKFPPQAQQQ
ncbi:DUF4837 family protein [uncultured Alistipes sp.]|jgi:hypothetical protein|uniref:DUF4837 family protein n=1 Tax=Alistipes sp. TaxID=1872444 RepID=UPI0025FC457E|nr:DUF4837 family protein [uncultured Alistipes sp.]